MRIGMEDFTRFLPCPSLPLFPLSPFPPVEIAADLFLVVAVALNALVIFFRGKHGGGPTGGAIVFGFDLFILGYE